MAVDVLKKVKLPLRSRRYAQRSDPTDYDTSAPQLDCDDMLRVYEHTVTVSFEKTGDAEIVFLGQKEDSSGVTQTTDTRTLEVR